MQQVISVRETVRELPSMPRRELATLWESSFGKPPNSRLRPELMRPVLAFRIQEIAYGGHSAEAVKKLRDTIRAHQPGSRSQTEATNRFKTGTRIIREWNGKTYEVILTPAGYQFDGQVYKSLSPIANRITGTRWSGPAFFGTKAKGGAK